MSAKPGMMPMMAMNPQIILLKEGTDTSQGRAQLLSNIAACLSVVDIIRTTLGPRGMDKLIVDAKGKTTISNDGATIMKLLDIVHPAARSLVDIARAQDAEVGDGTTSVVVLAGELLAEARLLLDEGIGPRAIIRGYRLAAERAQQTLNTLSISPEAINDTMLEAVAATSLASKLVQGPQRTHFARLAVAAVRATGFQCNNSISASLGRQAIGMKRITGGALQDSTVIHGVAFKKTFSYAGFEQQPKCFKNPKIILLAIELELRAERDNAEVRLSTVEDYAAIVEGEWEILRRKLEAIAATGAVVVLSRLPIGDVATQFFADRGIFCAGRVPTEDIRRLSLMLGNISVAATTSGNLETAVGTCALFEERQIGGERYNVFEASPPSAKEVPDSTYLDVDIAKSCGIVTLLLRGGSEQFIAEVERSLVDAISVLSSLLRNAASHQLVVGGGATEMGLSRVVREEARAMPSRLQRVIQSFAKALEVIPRQLALNGGLDSIDVMAQLRRRHAQGDERATSFGVNLVSFSSSELIADLRELNVWEPASVKANMLAAATEAASLILSVDETVQAAPAPPVEAK